MIQLPVSRATKTTRRRGKGKLRRVERGANAFHGLNQRKEHRVSKRLRRRGGRQLATQGYPRKNGTKTRGDVLNEKKTGLGPRRCINSGNPLRARGGGKKRKTTKKVSKETTRGQKHSLVGKKRDVLKMGIEKDVHNKKTHNKSCHRYPYTKSKTTPHSSKIRRYNRGQKHKKAPTQTRGEGKAKQGAGKKQKQGRDVLQEDQSEKSALKTSREGNSGFIVAAG